MPLEEHIVSTSPGAITFRKTEPVIRAFFKRNIFLDENFTPTATGMVPKPATNATVRIARTAVVEEFAQFVGDKFNTRGAFSYCQTSNWDFTCGRYCSLGNGLSVMGERHPLEYVTSSSMAYCLRVTGTSRASCTRIAPCRQRKKRPLFLRNPKQRTLIDKISSDCDFSTDLNLFIENTAVIRHNTFQ